jgi:hypothetical protein
MASHRLFATVAVLGPLTLSIGSAPDQGLNVTLSSYVHAVGVPSTS